METTTGNYELIADDLLVAVFYFFEKKKNLPFEDESNVMTAFYRASKKPKYSGFFENYHFDEDGVMPYSREIADALDILHQSSLLGKLNPTFCNYQLSNGIDLRFRKRIEPNLSDKQKTLLEELAEEIKQSLVN